MLDFRMETFLAVCRQKSYTRAAEELCITQPAVSQHIRCVEEHYGVKLFSYHNKKLVLTQAGKTLYPAISAMRHDEQQLKALLGELETGGRSLTFGATRTVGAYLMPPRLARLLHAAPQTELTMVTNNTKALLGLLSEGAIDFAVVEGNFPRQAYEHRLCGRERFVAVCAGDSPLAAAPCYLRELLTQPLVVREPGSGTRELLQAALEGRGYTIADFAKAVEISDMAAIKQLAAGGCGITFLYEVAAREELQRGILRKIEVVDLDVLHDISFLWQKGSLFAPRYEEIFKELFPPEEQNSLREKA